MTTPITFTLSVISPGVRRFDVPIIDGTPLLEALKAFKESQTVFRFETKNLPSSGEYVDSVMGRNSGPSEYWSTLLKNHSGEHPIPLSLGYKVHTNDKVILQFTGYTGQ